MTLQRYLLQMDIDLGMKRYNSWIFEIFLVCKFKQKLSLIAFVLFDRWNVFFQEGAIVSMHLN